MMLSVTFGIYLLSLIAIGVYFYFQDDATLPREYLIADRNVGPWPMAFSQIASMASGWTFFAWVGIGFTLGFFGFWWAFITVALYILLYRYLAPKFRRQSEELDSITMVDHLSRFYEARGSEMASVIRLIGGITVLVFLTAYVGAQIIAVGDAADIGLGIDYTTAIVVGGVAVALYTGLGGFNASVWTDFLQGILMVFLAFALPVALIANIGGWGTFASRATTEYPNLVSLSAGLGTVDLITLMAIFGTFAIAAIGQPHSLVRFQAIESERVISKAMVIAMFISATRMTMPLLIGVSARVLYETAEALPAANPENAAMFAIVDLFPAWLAGILLAGVVSAILSTSDSMLLLLTSDAIRLYEKYINPDASQQRKVVLSRLLVATVALFGVVIAFFRPGTLFDIILFAFVGLGVALGLPLVLLLFWDRMTAEGVVAGLVVGLGSNIVHAFWIATDLYPIFTWPVTIVAILGVCLVTGGEREVTQPAGATPED